MLNRQSQLDTKTLNFWQKMSHFLFSPHASLTEVGAIRQARLTSIILLVLTFTNGLGALIVLFVGGSFSVLTLLSLISITSYILSRTQYYKFGSALIIWTFAFTAFSSDNVSTALYTNLIPAIVFASIVFSFRYLLIFVSIILIGIGILPLLIPGYTNVGTDLAVFFPFALLSVTAMRYRENVERDRLAELENTNKELVELSNDLEQRVNERTQELSERSIELEKFNTINEQRARQFEAITSVSNAISSIRSLDELLPRITELISEQFGYYHVGIFLTDTNNEYAVLSAANSEGGKRMLQRGHQLKIGQEGLVGYTTNTGEPRIALDVGEDAVFFNNPYLPETHSEIALPLKVEDAVVGVLDVQSKKEAAFKEEDINVLSLLASQVSLAIENARLFDQARKSLAESEALYRQYLRQAWTRLPKEQNLAGYRYNARGSSPIEEKATGKTKIEATEPITEVQSRPRISVPISIRGETIGTLSVQIPESANINDDQMDLVNAVAERVALSAENARLFEETNRRAERERLVSDITVKIRSTNDPDAMIQVALDELKTALGATQVELLPHTLSNTGQITESAPPADVNTPRKTKNK